MKVVIRSRLETGNCVVCCVGAMLTERSLCNNSILGGPSPAGSDPSVCQENCTLDIAKSIGGAWTDEEMCIG